MPDSVRLGRESAPSTMSTGGRSGETLPSNISSYFVFSVITDIEGVQEHALTYVACMSRQTRLGYAC